MLEQKKIIASGGSAVGLSMFASFVGLCCIGPWTVALLGVSGAVSMARWQPFRPYILSVAGSLLAWAFWRTYRLRRGCLAEGCTDKPPGAAMYFSLWLSALLLVLAVFAERLQWLLVDPTPAALRCPQIPPGVANVEVLDLPDHWHCAAGTYAVGCVSR